MLTILEREKPRFVRVQKNAASGIFSINLPREVIEEAGWGKGDSVRCLVQDKDRILIERVGG